MAESNIPVASQKLHSWNRTIVGNSVEDEFTLPGEFPYATYSVSVAAISGATAASHLLQIMAGASNPVRIRSICVTQVAAPGAVTQYSLQIFRLTTAGTGGTAITPRPYDSADAAAGATAMTLPTVKGTEGVQLYQESLWLGTAAVPTTNNRLEWPNVVYGGLKPIIIPAGIANGLAIKNPGGLAASTFDITVEFVETTFV